MDIEDFIASEGAEGQKVSEGSAFTLNPAEVRSRVAKFCDQERLYPFYRCLQAMNRSARSDLFIRYDQDSWVASCRWPGIPSGKEFQDYLIQGISAPFDHVGHMTSQHLFFGLSAALGVPHYRLEWITPGGGFVVHNGKIEVTEKTHPEFCQLAFSIDARWYDKLTGGQRLHADTAADLRRRLCYSAVPVHIEGERLTPRLPEPPDRPWASRLAGGSNLAWRYLTDHASNRMRPPVVPLDNYRVGRKGKVWHLIKDDATTPLPLSIQFADLAQPARGDVAATRAIGSGERRESDGLLCQSALFLSLQAGRQDWLFPVRDGLLGEPVTAPVAQGGVLVVSADESLRYDLSGLNVIQDKRFDEACLVWQREAKALKKELRVSLANSTLRAETMPSQYYQASGYAFGGPVMGMLAGKVGPYFHRLASRRKAKNESKRGR